MFIFFVCSPAPAYCQSAVQLQKVFTDFLYGHNYGDVNIFSVGVSWKVKCLLGKSILMGFRVSSFDFSETSKAQTSK